MNDYLSISDLINPHGSRSQIPTITDGFEKARDILNHRAAYEVVNTVYGRKYIFSQDYINLLRIMLSTDCTTAMNKEERDLTQQFIIFESTGHMRNRAVIDLDKLFTDLANCKLPDVYKCLETDEDYKPYLPPVYLIRPQFTIDYCDLDLTNKIP